ncbi:M64 family metallo-endopeptidase, partial [Gammaproteobacteria bacterium]|nr:M64 family metallo-endopeptidase [Gammaproteobacteria bacterium]
DVAGLFDANLQVSDSTSTNSVSFTSWFISNKSTVTIQQDNDPDDGFDGGEKTPKDYLVYYLSGSPDSIGKTKYLFIGDSLDGETDTDLYRIALISSMNKLNDSDASDFFNPNYFTVISAEPINPDGTSPVGVRTGCYDYDEDIYCIGEMDVDIFDVLLPDNTLVSTLTRVQGRGVNLGYRNIQKIRDTEPERTSNTLMHELGHAHGYMGDEYRSDDDRDVSEYADLNVNTSTQSDVAFLKWNHHIEDQLNVLGRDIKVCYNTADGRIYDRDADEYVEGADCNCLANEWDSNGNFVRKNPECGKVGQFEGNYYGEFDNYRPTFCSIMDSCTSGGYGKVNVEGFAVGSLQNQGFYDDSNRGFVQNSNNENSGWQIVLDAAYDTSKVTLKWFVNGVEDTSKENQTDVIFNRPSNNGIAIYTAKAIDLTGTITATDDVTNHDDFYKGLFQTSFYWCAGYIQNDSCEWSYDPDPSRYSEFDYGYMNGPLGVTWGINWDKW